MVKPLCLLQKYRHILGVKINRINCEKATQIIMELAKEKASEYVCLANVHMIMEAQDSLHFLKIINGGYLTVPDGKPLAWIIKGNQVCGRELTLDICKIAALEGVAVGFYGSTNEVLKNLLIKMKQNYPTLNIVYAYSPPFRNLSLEEKQAIAQEINNTGIQILFVGLGCPKQERWMADNQGQIKAVMLGIGGAFDVLSGKKPQVPYWMQNLGLEWLFRLCLEPKRLWYRNLWHSPRFVIIFFLHIFLNYFEGVRSQESEVRMTTERSREEIGSPVPEFKRKKKKSASFYSQPLFSSHGVTPRLLTPRLLTPDSFQTTNYYHKSRKKMRTVHAFTVDVEDWYHGIADEQIRASSERRLDYGLSILLELLAEYEVKATFFWLGLAAAEHPKLVRQVAEAGHEIGCHGWFHEPIYTMYPKRFRDETQRASSLISDLTGKPVVAYRAPYFSITEKSFWALEILAELGFRYDSSIFPIRHWRYGIPDFEPRPQQVNTPAGSIYEMPISIRRISGCNIPVSGGAYFRLYPYELTKSNFYRLEHEGLPAIFYIHPWELDLNHPSVPLTWKERLTHYINLSSTESKLRQLLRDFSFGSLGHVLENISELNKCPL